MESRNIQLPSSTLARPSFKKKYFLRTGDGAEHKALGLSPTPHKLSMMLYAHNLSIQEGLGVQGYIGKT